MEQSEAAERVASSVRDSRPDKAPGAFRTIREVAEELGVPQHVLRFWESRFGQIRPLKRAGGRRYYRPEDVDLLKRIQGLLYQDGYTIRGVQKLFRDGGVKAVRGAPAIVASAAQATPGAASHLKPPAEPPMHAAAMGGETRLDKAKAVHASTSNGEAEHPLPSVDPQLLVVPRNVSLDEKARARLDALIRELEDLVGLLRGSTGS